jgi:mannose/cellobiose epimerase-like protein (N-acyl-D-glucosamine 2-epimerase family)
LETDAARSVTAVMDAHFNPDFRLTNEILNHDMSRPPEPVSQLVYTGHAIETLWMILYEAARRKDAKLFTTAAERFRRHVEVAWDDVYGGVFAGLLNVDAYTWEINKVLWAQEEVLIGSLFIYEHTGVQWAKEMFDRMHAYVMEKYPLKKNGYHLWINSADRKVTYEPHYNRAENFHHPRHLMLNLLALDRMIKRGGKPSRMFG